MIPPTNNKRIVSSNLFKEHQNSKNITSSQEGGINIILVNPVTASLE